MLFFFLLFDSHPSFLAIQGHYWVKKKNLPEYQSLRAKGEKSSWFEASFSTHREGSCSVLKSVAACPRVKVDLMLHKRTVSCLSLLHSTLKQCCLCAWSSNRKESSLPGKGHSTHGWEQADLTAFWEVTLPLVLCGGITRVLGHSCIPVGCSLSV